jgi:hypothetical protein
MFVQSFLKSLHWPNRIASSTDFLHRTWAGDEVLRSRSVAVNMATTQQ